MCSSWGEKTEEWRIRDTLVKQKSLQGGKITLKHLNSDPFQLIVVT